MSNKRRRECMAYTLWDGVGSMMCEFSWTERDPDAPCQYDDAQFAKEARIRIDTWQRHIDDIREELTARGLEG